MTSTFDVIVVGSGPAGVSASFPLVEAGLKVLMVDGGKVQTTPPPDHSFLKERFGSDDQWKWIVGRNFHASRYMNSVSPKLRVPTHDYVFENFLETNRITTKDFVAIGSLARGGLSNAWGCGVARLSTQELTDLPFSEIAMNDSYSSVIQRIGASGGRDDDLTDYIGLDQWTQPPIEMDQNHVRMYDRYIARRTKLNAAGFRMGRTRLAVLSRDRGDRKACDLSSNCLWGCHRKSLYTSADEIPVLRKYGNFFYEAGMVVEKVASDANSVTITGRQNGAARTFSAKKLVLAAGSLASTRLALQTINHHKPVPVQSCPTGAFLLWMPEALGAPRKDVFGVGQLSYNLKITDNIGAFGSTFSTTGIPVSEFARHLPLGRRFGIDVLRHLLSSCVVGNMFLPGHLSTTSAVLRPEGDLHINGGYRDDVESLLKTGANRLRRIYRQLGAYMLPMSFTMGTPGGDIHYSGTMPMRLNPKLGETDRDGALVGAPRIHMADAASLPRLTEKSHTLTIMANADRIARSLVVNLKTAE